MENKINVRKWIENFNNKKYEGKDFETQCEAGWYDWFCKDTSLADKTKKMGNIIKQITNNFILDNTYVFFKNNCPMCHPLYDSFKFCDLENGNVIFCVNIKERDYDNYCVYCDGYWERPMVSFRTSKELVKWFNSLNDEYIKTLK